MVDVTSRPLWLRRFSGRFAVAWASRVLFLPTSTAIPPLRFSKSSSLAPPLCDFLIPSL